MLKKLSSPLKTPRKFHEKKSWIRYQDLGFDLMSTLLNMVENYAGA